MLIKKNIVANFIGKGWTGIMLLAFVPVYIKFMGIEAYGLIGIYSSLFALLSLLDLGLSTTLNRELARMSVQKGKAQEMRDMVRTLELIYWIVAIFIALVVVLLAPIISYNWVRADKLDAETISQAVMIMGLAIAFQWPFSLYSGGLMGLQKQVHLNGIHVVMATLRGFGSVIILWQISPTIQAFFTWQIIIAIIQTLLTGYILWTQLPVSHEGAHFRNDILFNIWHFAAGMTGISILVVILTQLDKVILSGILTLEMFGYYSLATTVASGLSIIISPIFSAIFPYFTQIVSQGDEKELAGMYHKSCQLMSLIILPVGVITALFAPEILLMWTGDIQITEKTHLIMSLLVTGTTLNALGNIPYALQLAHGWTKLAIYQNLASVILLVPLIFWATNHYGAAGAASIWVILNLGYIFIGTHILHRKFLKQEKMRWYFQDVAIPFLGTILIALPARLIFTEQASSLLIVACLSVIFASTLLSTSLTIPFMRDWIKRRVFNI